MSFESFINRSDFKLRLASVLGAVTFILAGILLGLSIGAALFRWTFINAGPGKLLTAAYGTFAFMIPAYLFWAAWILLNPVFKPGRIFVLSATIIPFLTLALGFSLVRDFETRRQELIFLETLGRFGLSLVIITITLLEGTGILILHSVFFSAAASGIRGLQKQAAAPEQIAGSGEFAPAPAKAAPAPVPPLAAKAAFAPAETAPAPARAPAEAAFARAAPASGSPPAGAPGSGVKREDRLPEWKPLASSAAFREMEEKKRGKPPKPAVEPPVPPEPEKDEPVVLDPSVFAPYSQVSPSAGSGEDEGQFTSPAGKSEVDFTSAGELIAVGEEAAVDDEADTEEAALDVEAVYEEPGKAAPVEAVHGGAGEAEDDKPVLSGEEESFAGTAFFEIDPLAEDPGIVPEETPEVPEEEWDDADEGGGTGDDADETEDPAEGAEDPAEDAEGGGTEKTAGEILPSKVPPPLELKKNIRKHRGAYAVPVENILNQYADGQYWIIDEETKQASRTLQETLSEFGIQAEVTGIRKGPVITMFEILPAPGVKLSKIVNLQDNIALRLAASSVRIVAPIPGKHAVGIEVPNKKRNIVSFREIIEGELAQGRRENRRPEVPVVLGKGITGEAITADLTQMPHLLIAGSTGSGKSVCVNSLILSVLFQLSPAECRLILIDPKIVELKLYNDIPHLLTPVIIEPKRAFQALQYCIYEMERRYSCLDSMGVRDIKSYNRRIKERRIAAEQMPYIVVVIDEFADLMATTGKELESTVARLAAMSRAVGIHLVLATQRPSIDVITGLIKANIPSRIAFMVASKMDSRIIIDMVGAEKLLGKGDMLYAGAADPFPVRMQGAFVSEEEVERVVEYVKSLGEPEYIDDEIFYDEEEEADAPLFSEGEDPLYEKALEMVLQQKKASASYIQRRLKIGYNRAARLVEEMERQGVVGPAQGSKPRELLRRV
ncbi:MAG: DNA translocase FtsK [Spirochaetaceae bacterium]|nr:DNA translocase FtsK [Spirochaetaceae bacterium]